MLLLFLISRTLNNFKYVNLGKVAFLDLANLDKIGEYLRSIEVTWISLHFLLLNNRLFDKLVNRYFLTKQISINFIASQTWGQLKENTHQWKIKLDVCGINTIANLGYHFVFYIPYRLDFNIRNVLKHNSVPIKQVCVKSCINEV